MPVKASYRLRESQIRLEVGAYDHARPLVIDPVFVYSTFLAGSLHDRVTGVAVDSGGNAYITGITYSTDFPTASAYSTTCVSCTDPYALSPDLYVAKLDPTGSQLIYSTYIGGSRSETPWAIRVDGNGNAVLPEAQCLRIFLQSIPFRRIRDTQTLMPSYSRCRPRARR